jgi:hypothetical protein
MNKNIDIPEKERAIVLQGGDLLVRMKLELTRRFTNVSLKETPGKEIKESLLLI